MLKRGNIVIFLIHRGRDNFTYVCWKRNYPYNILMLPDDELFSTDINVVT
jgi:hypothetical protein